MPDYEWIANPNTWTYHIVSTPTRVPNRYKSVCGRSYNGETVDRLPGGAVSCETCLRLVTWKTDKK